jgi:uncharacterized Fe-S cluster protein YjdI
MVQSDAGLSEQLGPLIGEVVAIESVLAESRDAAPVAARLRDSVLRPLERITGAVTTDRNSPERPIDDATQRIWQLARDATALRAQRPNVAGLAEAVAALQDMAVARAESGDPAPERLAELSRLQSELPAETLCASNGPYLMTNPTSIVDWLGCPLPIRPQMAVCRCGGSAIKPLCNGSHTTNGFTDAKDARRVPDRLMHFEGQQVAILDNRGTCQHPGLCTDRLATVFRLREEPFVAPSRGRMDEIIRAVRHCPSGALSYAIDGVEARADVDHHDRRPPMLEVTKEGPLSDHRRNRASWLRRARDRSQPGRVRGALRALSLRPLSEQAVLQRHALVRRFP